MRRGRPRPGGLGCAPPRGIAVISALALVALVAILSIGVAWLGHLSIARAQVQRDAGQAAYLSEAVQEYARWILTADMRGEAGGSSLMDHLSEPWAQPIPHSRLDLLFGAQMSADDRRRFADGAVAGGLTDEQGRMNLAAVADELRLALAQASQSLNSPAIDSQTSQAGLAGGAAARLARELAASDKGKATARLIRLLTLLKVSASGQEALLGWITQTAATGLPLGMTPWLALNQALNEAPWLTKEDREALAERLVWLPEPTRINVNTADRFIVLAALQDADVGVTDAIIARRERVPFRNISELSTLFAAGSRQDMSIFDVQSRYFRLRGYAQFGQAESALFTLFFRQNQQVSRADEWLTD